MIDEKRLEELRKYDIHAHTSCDDLNECPFACEVIRISTDLLETLSLALQVVRAAQGLKIRGECWCGVAIDNPNCRGIHSPQCAAMKTALAPFAASEGTEESK